MISPLVVALAEAGTLPDVAGVLVLLALSGAGAGHLGPAGAQVLELAHGQAGALHFTAVHCTVLLCSAQS